MNRILVLAALAAAASVAGCETRVPPTLACDFTPQLAAVPPVGPALAETSGGMRPVPLNTVSMTDVEITNKVMVQQVTASRTPTNTVALTTRFANCTDYPLQVEARVHFLDMAQQPTEPVSAWQRIHLPARSFAVARESSTDAKNVAAYLIEVREGH
jgi:hypothetical protein